MQQVSDLLSRLNKTLRKEKEKKSTSFADLKALRKKDIVELKEGKNNFIFITPNDEKAPIKDWAYHANLQEVAWYTIPCSSNYGEECMVCKIIEELKAENFKGNMHIWSPIQVQYEYYAPVIDVENEATIAQGVKWLRLPKGPMTTVYDWLDNLEKDEQPFYSNEEPQKIILTYEKKALPKDKYKLDKKNAKPFSQARIDEWSESLKEISNYFIPKGVEETKKLIDSYLIRVEEMVKTPDDKKSEEGEPEKITSPVEVEKEIEVKVETKATSRLSALKNK